jgi:hypothetical protein
MKEVESVLTINHYKESLFLKPNYDLISVYLKRFGYVVIVIENGWIFSIDFKVENYICIDIRKQKLERILK